MVLVGRLPRDRTPTSADDVRGGVGERVEAVGEDADRAGDVAERDLRDRDGEIQEEDADEDADDGVTVARRQTRRR